MMISAQTKAWIAALRKRTQEVRYGFPTVTWEKVSGPGPETIKQGGWGFQGLALTRSCELVLRTNLEIPAQVHGVELAGQPLDGLLGALYPTHVTADGKAVFEDEFQTVAAGPALFTVLPKLEAGKNGEISFRVRVPDQQPTQWVNFRLTTPSLRQRFEQLDIAWARFYLAAHLAESKAELATVEKAGQFIEPIIATTGAEELSKLLESLAGALGGFADKIGRFNVHLIGHSHIDMNWLWTWPDTVEVIKRDFRSVVKLMQDYPELTFSHSQPATYEVVRKDDPQLFQQVLRYIRQGRWEATTMQWVETDTNMVSGEGHIRQLLQAVRYSREVLGTVPTTFHAPDTFGHAGNLPQLAASAGAKRYYHHRANPGQANQWPAYWWEGIDGTRLLAISSPSYNGDITAGDLATAAVRAQRFGHKAALHFHGIGDHGGGPARQNLDALQRFQKLPLLPKAQCSTLAAYTQQILGDGTPLPLHKGESSTIFEGCYTTHADTKRYNRWGENLLCTADTLAALAGLENDEATTDAWRKVLFNQFHDIIDGSAIHEAYIDNAKDYAAAEATAKQRIAAALDVLESDLPSGSIVVTNPLGHERTDVVCVDCGDVPANPVLVSEDGAPTPGQKTEQGLCFVAKVPAFASVSYRVESGQSTPATIEAVPADPPTRIHEDYSTADDANNLPYYRIENERYVLFVRRDCGIIVSLLDKRLGRNIVPFGLCRASDYHNGARPDLALGVLQFIEEAPHSMSAWEYQEVRAEQSLITGATTRVVESGPVRCVVEAEHRIRSSTLKQRITVYRELARIDFELEADWKEVGNSKDGVPGLKVAFTTNQRECQAWFETPFGAVRRPADGMEAPALRWAEAGGENYGAAVLNDSKYGYDILGNRVRLTLLRSGYDPDTISDAGQHTIRYSFLPHTGSWREAGVVKEGLNFNQPLLARVANGATGSGTRLRGLHLDGAAHVILSGLKPAEHGEGVILRLYESAGQTANVSLKGLPEALAVYEANVLEDPGQRLTACAGELPLRFGPWQVRTLLLKAVE